MESGWHRLRPEAALTSFVASAVNDESDLRNEEHDDPRISTFRGISIDGSDDFRNASG
jgi:hypothetical protein